jgi:hypothetical protein
MDHADRAGVEAAVGLRYEVKLFGSMAPPHNPLPHGRGSVRVLVAPHSNNFRTACTEPRLSRRGHADVFSATSHLIHQLWILAPDGATQCAARKCLYPPANAIHPAIAANF